MTTKHYESTDTVTAKAAFDKAMADYAAGGLPTRTLSAARDRLEKSKARDAELERVVTEAIAQHPEGEGVAAVCRVIEERKGKPPEA